MENNKELIPTEKKLVKKKGFFSKDIKLNGFTKNKKNKKEEKKIRKNVVSFDIGSSTIKIAEGKYDKGKLTIEKVIKIATPKNSMGEGEIKIKDTVATMIGAALRQYNIKSKDAICTTNPSALISREISIPKVEDDEIDTVVRFEIQQYLPINLDDCIIQTTILDEFEDELDNKEKYNIRVIVYPKRIALEYYKLLTDLNLRPYALDVNFNALNKLINYKNLNDEKKGSIVLLDMGANFIDVNIYRGSNLDFTRRIKFGGNDIEETLIQDAMIDESQVKEIVQNKIDLTDEKLDSKYESKSVQNSVDELINKVEMILQFYRNKSVENNISKIYIFGGVSKFKGIQEYMEMHLNIETRKLDDLIQVPQKKNSLTDNFGSDYLNAIGAIIRL